MGTRGFSGRQSLLYHIHEPTRLLKAERLGSIALDLMREEPLEPRHLATARFASSGDAIESRVWLLGNSAVRLGLATPTTQMCYWYRNGVGDELIFVHSGSGIVHTQFGDLPFAAGDYVVIPVGTTYQLAFQQACRLLVLETTSSIEIPRRYLNDAGQFNEFAPFCERDLRVPKDLRTFDSKGEFEVRVNMGDSLHRTILDHHPFDVVGWDGFLYPWIFNIKDFEPITGRIHQPPPVHQTFHTDSFVVCSFVPRLYDYHPQAIPVPYHHSNVNSDEVLYYVAGEFMSRRGIDQGSFTHHPAGIPHGPHPGTVERSLGQRETAEMAVMIDTFAPLFPTKFALTTLDRAYPSSWITP